MIDLVRAFPRHLSEGWELAGKSNIALPTEFPRQVMLCGLGGSAFGAEVLKSLLDQHGRLPLKINREYTIPSWVGQGTLVICSSYSGNTEETLTAFDACLASGAQIIVLSSGGMMSERARHLGIPLVTLPPGLPPRAAAGYSIGALTRIANRLGLFQVKMDIPAIGQWLSSLTLDSEARVIASDMHGKIPVLYVPGFLECAAIRWRQQINENAKQLCWHHVTPEMNHNELVGWKFPSAVINKLLPVFLHSPLEHPRVKVRADINLEIISEATTQVIQVQSPNLDLAHTILYLIHLGDLVSVFLAEQNEVDPYPVPPIERLKTYLATH